MAGQTLEQAVKFAVDHETTWDRETTGTWGVHQQDPAPWNRLLGPVHDRGPVSGTVVVRGRSLASWGEPRRADLTFSVAKTYLALLAGVAHDRGLLPDVREPVGARLKGIGFDSGNNARVSWEQMLQQTSEWTGDVFGLPDQVDHYRAISLVPPPDGRKGDRRPLREPGSYWEYNDVRINQLSLALLHLFQRPLPEVFREAIMRPIGASEDWRWLGYDDAWVTIAGNRMQSVPGGTHWGGGVSIGSDDQALVGQLMLNEGLANDGQRVLSSDWIRRMRTPCALAPYYGYLLWLNTDRQVFPSVPDSSYFAFGAGSSFTWVEPGLAMVVVVRWIDPAHADEFFGRVLQAVDGL
ncbi:MAG: serine hydrolase [Ramlibacter sp.]|nr:serine hydrolase [Ramlibacter sp.]